MQMRAENSKQLQTVVKILQEAVAKSTTHFNNPAASNIIPVV